MPGIVGHSNDLTLWKPADWQRFLSRVAITPGGCWLWTGGVRRDKYGVYGRIVVARHSYLVHRVAWMAVYGPIPAGLDVDHRCFVRLCVNPSLKHLDLCTRGENTARRHRRP